MSRTLTLALSKGRILQETLPLLARCGIEPQEDPDASRRLIIGTNRGDVRLLVVRASDVPTYVEHGGADLGVAGRDVLLEHGGEGLYDPVDLGIARCRLMVAGPPHGPAAVRRPRVATKFVHLARQHFAEQGRQAEIIKLYGSMELAPLVGMADLIVDLVDTGNTLRANGLAPLEPIMDISARLVVNKASLKTSPRGVGALIEDMAEASRAPAAS
ncbi:MAG: ATP phosphoribosyltransferase [Halorhodospira sp.]